MKKDKFRDIRYLLIGNDITHVVLTILGLILECLWYSKAADLTSGNMYAHTGPIQEFTNCSDAIFAEAIELTKEAKNFDYVSFVMNISMILGILELILVVVLALLHFWLYDVKRR